jgi:hypothetical protein
MAERDPAFGQIVGGEFHGDAVARQNADAVTAEAAGEVRENYAVMLQLDAEKAAREFLEDRAGDFDAVFFTQTIPFFSLDSWSGPGRSRPARFVEDFGD